jgi:hypothetical protein
MTTIEWALIGALIYLATSAFTLFRLWVFYLAVMSLQRLRDSSGLDKRNKALGSVALVIGYLLDAYVNIFVMSVLLLEFPRELTVTARLKRHNLSGKGWGKRVALWFEPILDPHDPSGDHI